MVVEPERSGEHAPLIELIRPDARIVEVDRQRYVSARQPLDERARRCGDGAPVESGVAVGRRLTVDQGRDRRRSQARGAELPLAVAVKDRLGVGVAAAPSVRVVGVDRLVGGEPRERPQGQLLERVGPGWEAAQQLRGCVRSFRSRLAALAFERALVWLRGPTAHGFPAQIWIRRRGAGGGCWVRHAGLLMRRFSMERACARSRAQARGRGATSAWTEHRRLTSAALLL